MDNLDPDYLQFVENNGDLKHFAQEVLDRVQYSPNFFTRLKALMLEYDSPFEYVTDEKGEIVRRLKPDFQTQNLQCDVA